MRRLSNQGLFLTVEGGHGAGKTSLVAGLAAALRRQRISVTIVTDIGGTETGRSLRSILLGPKGCQLAPLTEALLIASCRHQNVVEIIAPHLAGGEVVIAERYNDAFYAFQVAARGLPKSLIDCLSAAVAQSASPEITFLLDVDPRIGLARTRKGHTHRIEREPLQFHDRVRRGYLLQAKRFPRRIHVLDGSQAPTEILSRAWDQLSTLLDIRKVTRWH
jgi:dTMP kinase